ncbi:hypothetical protein MYSTI_01939 [Myxococcus stipitatus DSM 14675]|uniref:Uncharacterized protein n=1 Tax=Myxococcus stipitatus (strain DSM 14675 / JCM 12634 / Mx s8) TaxID=1278073 RepID=L7U5Y6_MYXSD|nr:hypothetical protein MYSTI_01939 [Myxococcus stipitatus DSM 14675]
MSEDNAPPLDPALNQWFSDALDATSPETGWRRSRDGVPSPEPEYRMDLSPSLYARFTNATLALPLAGPPPRSLPRLRDWSKRPPAD